MKVADLSSPEEVAIFDNAKADVEAARSFWKNDMEVVDVTMDAPSLEDTMPDNERLMRALKKQMQVEICDSSIYGNPQDGRCAAGNQFLCSVCHWKNRK